jgi:hypothetical protein
MADKEKIGDGDERTDTASRADSQSAAIFAGDDRRGNRRAIARFHCDASRCIDLMTETSLEKYDWKHLNHLQVGRYAEYFAKMEFTLFGFDVYTVEVDHQGIDFVIRKGENHYYDVQVKSLRKPGYVFFPKTTFPLRPNMLAVVSLFFNPALPDLYLIPATAWLNPNGLLVGHDFEGLKGKPEWGLNLSMKNKPLLAEFEFEKQVKLL